MTTFFSFRNVFLIAGCVLAATACKKSGGGGDNTGNNAGYFLTATVGGKAWAANVANDTLHSPVIAAITSSGSAKLVLLLGVQAAGKDSTAIAIVFPQNIVL